MFNFTNICGFISIPPVMDQIKLINGFPHIRYELGNGPPVDMEKSAHQYFKQMNRRRTVRDICDKPVPKSVIDHLLMTASTAPSGAKNNRGERSWTRWRCFMNDFPADRRFNSIQNGISDTTNQRKNQN
jgi:hypothetical protein